ncbi:enoyl-CoA hydratase/isomerase family protein [Paralcaligenes ureilyticus]|uniref:Methylglutaconyl-CoA hydratase n=1 Tax=Paralcaligenes ureilyticus TaxID=627131 RepID=A0A4R3LYB7_9BURK|nr:enoyl-CoA hydratase/isomerase family protein [Paralcaligenes ureilyticus]TCT04819.1 methylglutaconyl-CoA hydratase [Paralcaligenes ureilyticus]
MPVEIRFSGSIAIITLNNPEDRNSLSMRLVTDTLNILNEPVVQNARAIVITAIGPAFCAGANIDDLLRSGWMEGLSANSNPSALFRRIASYPRPVIAAVQGMALGGGFELMLSCDLAIASDSASFSLPEIGHGVVPNTGLALLAPMVGRRKALELMLTRRRISAQEALELGIVNVVTPSLAVTHTAIALAESIVSGASPGAIAEIKTSLDKHAGIDWDEIDGTLKRLPPAEWQEGLSAFTEHRPPKYDQFWEK